MASVIETKKACAVNPLKMSQPLGACYAFLGMSGCMPMMHGSQGCTSFGLVLLVRHFKEAIPLQTTAMSEVSTILGGFENIEQAVLNIKKRANPELIAIASTGLTETKGDDVDGYLELIRRKHGEVLGTTQILYVSTPDYIGAFQDGWAKAVAVIMRDFAQPAAQRSPTQINVLAGCHLSPADIEELREIVESFGLRAIIAPDLSRSVDGHIPENFTPTTLGGTTLDEIAAMGASCVTLAVGAQMLEAAKVLQEKTGVPYRVIERVCGLGGSDELFVQLADISGQPVAPKYRRQRGQLQDVMLDAHFFIGGKKLAIGAEPDLLAALSHVANDMGAEVVAAITTTASPVLQTLPCAEVQVGDLEDLERLAKERGAEMLLTHAHGRQAAARLKLPLVRVGLPVFDRLGASHKLMLGYRGTRELLLELANTFLDTEHIASPGDWPLSEEALAAARGQAAPSCGGGCSCADVSEEPTLPLTA